MMITSNALIFFSSGSEEEELSPGSSAGSSHSERAAAYEGTELGWYDVQLHSHSDYSDGWSTPGELMDKASYANLDGLALTDHNTAEGCWDPEFVETDGVIPIFAEEWGENKGHALVWGVNESIPPDPEVNATEMVQMAKEQGALVAPAHPRHEDYPWEWGYDLDIDAFEVWNYIWEASWPYPDGRNEEAVQTWHDLLVEGRKITAVAGSDFHAEAQGDLESPCVAVAAENHSQEAILEGIESGRVMVKYRPSDHPDFTNDEIYFEADGDADGVYESIVGDEIGLYDRHLPAEIPFKLTVRNRSGSFVHLHTKEGHTGVVEEVTSDDWVYEFNKTFEDIDDFDFLRAEVRGGAERYSDMYCLTNPIWLDVTEFAAVETMPPKEIGMSHATLEGDLTTLEKEVEADVFFRYRQAGETGWSETSRSVKNSTGTFTEGSTDLDPLQEYEFKACAEVEGEEVVGDILTFVPADLSRTIQLAEGWITNESMQDLRTEGDDLMLDIVGKG
ncbi:MAG: CehA/McbA family metallohydrolase, partial [Candidatus Aenigmatarchaeota archaeon]